MMSGAGHPTASTGDGHFGQLKHGVVGCCKPAIGGQRLDARVLQITFDHVAITVADNLSSQGLMERLGMTRRSDLDFWDKRFGPELNPSMVWRIESGEWPATRARALEPRP